LAFRKKRDFDYDLSIIITANEVNDYFEVVLKALGQIDASLAQATKHLGHGMMKLASGKMSSRTGKIIAGDELLNRLQQAVMSKMKDTHGDAISQEELLAKSDAIAVAAIKYSILKSGIGNDIVFDESTALNLTGNSGPYLQYTYARAMSILAKVEAVAAPKYLKDIELTPHESALLLQLHKFSEAAFIAAERLSPSTIATYAHQLAQKFNTYYAEVPIIGAENEELKAFRLSLVSKTSLVLSNALDLLGISVVDKM
jgi:arginyl-tRNA synthetase